MKLFDETIFKSIIARNHPDIEEKDVTWFNDGWDHVVGVVNNTIAYRFPRREDYEKRLPKETQFTALLRPQLNITIPHLELAQDSQSKLIYATYNFIQGKRFTRQLFQQLSGESQANIAKEIGIFLNTLHSFPVQTAQELGIEKTDTLSYWQQRFERLKQTIFSHISAEQQEWSTKLFDNFFSLLQKIHYTDTVIHGDIAPEHILINQERHHIAGIIDFGDISIGDPAYDFFQLSYYYGEDFLLKVYFHYNHSKDEAFEQRRKFYQDTWPLKNLEHSILSKNHELIPIHDKQLKDYIAQHS